MNPEDDFPPDEPEDYHEEEDYDDDDDYWPEEEEEKNDDEDGYYDHTDIEPNTPVSSEEYKAIRKEAENFLRIHSGTGADSTWYVERIGLTTLSRYNDICFASLSSTNTMTYKFIGIGWYHKHDDNLAHAFFKFLTCKKTSPWRELHKGDVKVVKDKEGNYRGLYFGEKAMKSLREEQKWNFLLNWMIATRTLAEFRSAIRFWKHCVDVGIEPSRAFIYCRHFSKDADGPEIYVKKIPVSYGHWPLNYNVDFKRFHEGKASYKNIQSGAIFNEDRSHDFDPLKSWIPEEMTDIETVCSGRYGKSNWHFLTIQKPLKELDEYIVKTKGLES